MALQHLQPTSSSSRSLTELVQSLPPEIYNEILKLTFTIDFETCRIDGAFTLPSILQVNQHYRGKLAESFYFYATSTFFHTGFETEQDNLANLKHLVKSLEPKQRERILFPNLRIRSVFKPSSVPAVVKQGLVAHVAAVVSDAELSVTGRPVHSIIKPCADGFEFVVEQGHLTFFAS